MLNFYDMLTTSDEFNKPTHHHHHQMQKAKDMPMDVKETEKDYKVSVEMPGINKDDVKLSVEGNQLTISYEKEEEEESEQKDDKGAYVFRERRYRSSTGSRTVSFPKEANLEKIDAKYNHGVLELMVPKMAKEADVKYIDIK